MKQKYDFNSEVVKGFFEAAEKSKRKSRFRDFELSTGLEIPKSFNEFKELEDYPDFYDFFIDIDKDYFLIPYNDKVNENFKYLPNNRIKIIDILLHTIPLFIVVIFLICGIIMGYYWFLITLPLLLIFIFINAQLKGTTFYTILLLFTLTSFFLNFVIGAILSVISINVFSWYIINRFRKYSMLKCAKIDEEIFCFLFYTKTLAFFDRKKNKIIFSGMPI